MAGAFQSDAFQNDAFQSSLEIAVPAAVITLTGSAELETLEIAVPAGAITLTGSGPAAATNIPAATVTLTGSAGAAERAAVPAGAVTLTGAALPLAVNVPAGLITLSGRVASVTSTGGAPIVLAGTRLFHGQVTARDAVRDKGVLQLKLEVTDLNRLWPLYKVGAAPGEGTELILPDGTRRTIDPEAFNYGIGPGDGGVFKHLVASYFPIVTDRDTHVHTTNPDYLGLPVLDWSTAYTDLRAVLDEFASRQGPYTRYRVDQDQRGWWTTLAPTGTVSDFAVPAMFKLTGDATTETATLKMANIRGRVEIGQARTRVFIRGGTPPANKWVAPVTDVLFGGEEYIDAPGAVTETDADAIGLWHLQNRLRPLYSGTAEARPDLLAVFHVLETVWLTDAELSRDTGFVFADTPTTILGLTAELKAGADGLSIIGLNTGMDQLNMNRVEWKSLTWAESINGPEKANISLTIWDPAEEFSVADLAFVTILTDGTAAIQWNLQWGDVPAGSLAKQQRGFQFEPSREPVAPRPAVRFEVTVMDPGVNVGGLSYVRAQLQEEPGKAKPVPEVPLVWLLEQWSDDALTTTGTGYSLEDTDGTTDVAGAAYTVLRRAAGSAVAFRVSAYALEIVP